MLKNFYNKYWTKRLQDLDDEELHLADEHRFFEQFIGEIKHSAILEVGCGIGSFCKRYIENNFVIGVDISLSALHHSVKKGIEGVVSDAIDLPFKNESFNVVILKDILEHIPLPSLAVMEAKRVVENSGRIFIWVPNIAFFANRVSLLLGRFNDFSSIDETIDIIDCEHLHFFDKYSTTRLLRNKGLKISRLDYVPISFSLFKRGIKRLLNKNISFAFPLFVLYRLGYVLWKSLFGLYIVLTASKE